jgi:hypothetical protein
VINVVIHLKKTINDITQGEWCGYCANQKLCNNIECNECFYKSFASHPKSKYWSNENLIDARNVFKRSDSKTYLFLCNECNCDFEAFPYNISIGAWCPKCVNKTEKILYDFVKSTYELTKRGFVADWCKHKRFLPFDIIIPELKIIIELDGLQHFKQVSNWKSPEKTQQTDIYKMKCALNNGYHIIRLLQEDVYYNKYNWKYELIKYIDKLNSETVPCVTYMCKNNEYDIYINSF